MEKQPTAFSVLLRVIHPWQMAAATATYALGLGIVHHLVAPVNWSVALMGLFIILLLLQARNFLDAYFLHPYAPENILRAKIKTEDPYPGSLVLFQRPVLFWTSMIMLGAGALLTVLLQVQKAVNPAAFLLLGVGLLLSYFSAVPPFVLNRKGYGDLIEALLIANLSPAFAFLLQQNGMHILLFMLTFPLTFFYLAARLVGLLRAYGNDVLTDTQSMLVRMGWQGGMTLHNYLVIGGYLLIGIFALITLPWSLTWPAILSLPLGIFQIFQVLQIRSGAKPNWRLLLLTAGGTFGITAYMIALTLWLR